MEKRDDIMRSSPLDGPPAAAAGAAPMLVPLTRTKPRKWVPSRYNARALDDEGRMILWNTYSGAISVFEAAQSARIESLLSQKGISGELSPIGAYLRDRGYLVRGDMEERQRLQLDFGRQHYRSDALQLILLSSEDCNFRCKYCYEEFARGTMLPSVRQGVKRLVEARAPGLRELRISWFGGEPLYGWEAIEELGPFLLEIARKYELAYRTHMTTNGYLLTREIADRLLEWEIRDFQITLDGNAEDHDRKRVARDGRGTFETIFENLRALHRRNDSFSVTVRVNYDQENHPGLERFLDRCSEAFGGDDRFGFSFSPVGRWGGPNDADLATCGVDESRAVRARLRRAAESNGLRVEGGVLSNTRLGSQVCYAARPFNFIVGADGKLMKCTVALDTKDFNVVGRLTPEGEMELDAEKLALWTEPAFQNDSTCGGCHMSPTCQGMHCPLIRIEDGKRPCPDVKRNLRSELLRTLEASTDRARRVAVSSA